MCRPDSIIKSHGGKSYLAGRIVELMPKHTHYLEPFAGGLAVLLAKDPEGISEVVNDVNGDLIGFYRVLRDEVQFERFCRQVEALPFSRAEWEHAKDHLGRHTETDPVDRAIWFFTMNRMSLAGRMDRFTSVTRTRTRRGMNGETSAWLTAVDGLPQFHSRLRRVLIEHDDALTVMRRHDGPSTLQYCDPPYLPETRVAKGVYGIYEMSAEKHEELLQTALSLKSKVIISGYPSEMYDRLLSGWSRHTFDLANHAAGGEEKRRMTEVLWANF